MAMNGWGEAEPVWWLNLQAHPDTTVDLVGGPRHVTARAAQGPERDRLWGQWGEINKKLDAYAARRSKETAVVVFEPRTPSSVSERIGEMREGGTDATLEVHPGRPHQT
jgi:F420H(2)-dependent quinone reductase